MTRRLLVVEEGMEGAGARRYCDACCRTVLDFAYVGSSFVFGPLADVPAMAKARTAIAVAISPFLMFPPVVTPIASYM